jgi:hypothetical protein
MGKPNIRRGVKEMHLIEQGKMQGRPFSELPKKLDEL